MDGCRCEETAHTTDMSYFSSHAEKLKAKPVRKPRLVPSIEVLAVVETSQFGTRSTSSTIQENQSTKSFPVRRCVFDRKRLNIESHQLVWCDAHVHSVTNEETTLAELRRIVDYTQLFDSSELCKQYLQETPDTASFLVCSDSISEQLIPAIHHLHNIHSVYIYSRNNEHHQQWPAQYEKIRQVYTDRRSLLQELDNDVKKYLEQEKGGLFGDVKKQDRTTESGSGSWWVTLMDVLCHLPYPSKACHHSLITELRSYYVGKVEELHLIDEFERDYTPDRAVWWYTRDTFLFRLINKANRQHNVGVMFAFGYYIRDLFLQLKKEHENFEASTEENAQVKVFRGQIMFKAEVEALKSAYMLRLNSFLSTSLNRRLAVSFLPTASTVAEGCVRVLIEINLNARCNSKPFGNIAHLSEFSNESEVLLMIGTFLRIRKSTYSEEEKIVKLILTLEDDYILPFEGRYTSLKKCVSLVAEKVCEDAPLEEINIIFDELDELFPLEKGWLKAEHYRAVGGYHEGYRQKNYTAALMNYKQALTVWQSYFEDSSVGTANLHLQVSRLYYYDLEEEKLAQVHYDAAIMTCTTALEHLKEDERHKAALYQILATAHLEKAEMDDQWEERKHALHYEKLRLQTLLTFCPPTDREVGLCYRSIGELQDELGFFDAALVNYDKACHVCIAQRDKAALPRTYQRMSRICEDNLNDLSSALKYRLLKHDAIVETSDILPFHDPQDIEDRRRSLVECHMQLADTHLKLHHLQAACASLTTAKKLCEDMDWKSKVEDIEEKLSTISRLEQDME